MDGLAGIPTTFESLLDLAFAYLAVWRAHRVEVGNPRSVSTEREYTETIDATIAWTVEQLAEDGDGPGPLTVSSEQARAALGRLVRRAAETLELAHVALAIADGIQQAVPERLYRDWLDRIPIDQVVILTAGMPYVVPPVDLTGQDPSTNPAQVPVPGADLPYLRVWRDEDAEVRLRRSVALEHAWIGAGDRAIDVLLPNDLIAEVPASPVGIFPVGPVDVARQTQLIDVLLATTESWLAVLPEVSVTPAIVDSIAAREGARPVLEDPRVIVAGSAHMMVDGRKRNVATTIIGDERFEHFKFNPWRQDAAPGSQTPAVSEGIDVDAPVVVTIVMTPSVRLVTVICRDLLHPGTSAVLARAGVTHVCVPSRTPKTDGFRNVAGGLVFNQQATTVVANGPREAIRSGHMAAVVTRPRALGQHQEMSKEGLPGQSPWLVSCPADGSSPNLF